MSCTGQQTFSSKSGSVIVSGREKKNKNKNKKDGGTSFVQCPFAERKRHPECRVSSRQCTDRVAVNHQARLVGDDQDVPNAKVQMS